MLRSKRYGAGAPLLLLHGLFGSADAWHPVARALGEDFAVHAVDQRNHGPSVKSAHMDYDAMAEDARAVMVRLGLGRAALIGHSMGGKTAMRFASRFPEMTAALVVVDIAPRGYPPIHAEAIEALARLDLDGIAGLREAEAALAPDIPDPLLRRFLLKSLDRTPEGGFRWKVNLPAIRRAYPTLCAPLMLTPWPGPCLFVRGAASDYITDGDWAAIRSVFPQARLATIPGAGHWVQADDPAAFIRTVSRFLLEAAALSR